MLDAIGETDHRLVNLLTPPVLDLGFSFGFLGFVEGTYTKSLLEPWYPPNGPFDGFGEVTYYLDKLKGVSPLDSQLDDVYPLLGETKGVMMVHPDVSQTADSYAQAMRQNPEIIFLFHGLPDKHGGGPDEQAAIRELLATYDGQNMYYSLDVAPLMHAPEIGGGSSIGMQSENGQELAALVADYGAQRLAEHVYDVTARW